MQLSPLGYRFFSNWEGRIKRLRAPRPKGDGGSKVQATRLEAGAIPRPSLRFAAARTGHPAKTGHPAVDWKILVPRLPKRGKGGGTHGMCCETTRLEANCGVGRRRLEAACRRGRACGSRREFRSGWRRVGLP